MPRPAFLRSRSADRLPLARPSAEAGSLVPGRLHQLQRRAGNTLVGRLATSVALPPIVQEVLRSPGVPLDAGTRAFVEPRFGHDFSTVRVHSDARAAASARAVHALAYTTGRDVVFGAGQYAPHTTKGMLLLAHELDHVVRQASPDGRADSAGIQRYEAGEHAEFGEAGEELTALVAARAFSYQVKVGETLQKIASKFKVPVVELKRLNAPKLKRWRATNGSGQRVEGFNAGDQIKIPPVVNDVTREALGRKELVFTVGGLPMDYGVGVSMGDFFESPDQMVGTPPNKLEALGKLIKTEQAGGSVSPDDWERATDYRYLNLAEKNEAHFAPSDPRLVTVSGLSRVDHKTEWEKHHKNALASSQGGKKNEAFRINAFGDHFLTDAFAGGHLINKRDVMERFKSRLVDPAGAFTKDAMAFFDAVAKGSFTGDVKATFAQYETVEWKGKVFRPNINSTDRFSALLQGIHEKEPDVLANAISKAVHDTLNALPRRIPVENSKGDRWNLSGDGTLNTESKTIGRRAVAQSQLNMLDVFKLLGTLDLPRFYKKVWDYVPRPSALGVAEVRGKVESGTDPREPALVSAVVTLIHRNYGVILKKLVERKILQKA